MSGDVPGFPGHHAERFDAFEDRPNLAARFARVTPTGPDEFYEEFRDEGSGDLSWNTIVEYRDETGSYRNAEADFVLAPGWTWDDYYDTVRQFALEQMPGSKRSGGRVSPNKNSAITSAVNA